MQGQGRRCDFGIPQWVDGFQCHETGWDHQEIKWHESEETQDWKPGGTSNKNLGR